jgi:uncharacterized membrane protein
VSELAAVIYPDEHRASAVLTTLKEEQIVSRLNLSDAVSVTRKSDGKVRLDRGKSHADKVGDAFWEMLVGLLFLTTSIGVVADERASNPSGMLSDYGIDDKFVQQLDTQVTPGSSAVLILVWDATPDTVLSEVAKFGGTMLRTGLGKEADVRLWEALT